MSHVLHIFLNVIAIVLLSSYVFGPCDVLAGSCWQRAGLSETVPGRGPWVAYLGVWSWWGACQRHATPPLGHLGAILVPSWCHLGAILVPSWCHLGAIGNTIRNTRGNITKNTIGTATTDKELHQLRMTRMIFPTSEVRDEIEWQWILSGLSLVQILRLDLEDQGKANSAGLNLSMINRQTHFPALWFQSWGCFLGWSPCGFDADLCSCFIHPHRPGMNKNYNELQV